jgi:hypothetical protein
MIDPATVPVPPADVPQTTSRKKLYLALGSFFILICIATGGFWAWSNGLFSKAEILPQTISLTITANNSQSDGIDPTTTFSITSTEALSPQTLENALITEPPIPFEITRLTPTSFTLKPQIELAKDSLYKFKLVTDPNSEEMLQTWAFQTQGEFRITQVTPRDKASSVPTNTSIELVFSHEQFEDPAAYVSFSPSLTGRWERHFQTAVFIPEKIEPQTLYTITVDPKLQLIGTDKTLQKERVIQFETAVNRDNQTTSIQREITEFSPDETPVISINTYPPIAGEITTKIYQFPSSEAFADSWLKKQEIPDWAYASRDQYQPSTQGLPVAKEFSAPLQTQDYLTFVVFPEALSPGWYLTELSIPNQPVKKYVWMQVSYLAAYTSYSETQSLAWVQDRQSGQPINQANVSIYKGGKLGETDAKGLAVFSTPSEVFTGREYSTFMDTAKTPPVAMLKISANGQSLVLPAFMSAPSNYRQGWGWYDYQSSQSQQYWEYLDFDKPVYKPQDTVQFWGVMRPREKTTKLPTGITANIVSGYGDETVKISNQAVPVEISSDGTYIGKIDLPLVKPGGYVFQLTDDQDHILVSRYIDVATYVKPAYSLELTTAKQAAFAKETIAVSGKASFFEGTPVAQLAVKLDAGNQGEAAQTKLVTDAQGMFSGTFVTSIGDTYNGTRPQSQYLNLTPFTSEEGDIYASESILVFPSKYLARFTTRREGDQAQVALQLNTVDLSKQLSEFPKETEYTGPAANQATTTVTVKRIVYDKVDAGELYNPILRTVEKRYNYNRREEFVKSETLTTNEAGQAFLNTPIATSETLLVTFSIPDPDGRVVEEQVYVWGGQTEDQAYTSLVLETTKEAAQKQGTTPTSLTYDANENITVNFKKGNQYLQSGDRQHFLFRVAQRGFRAVQVDTQPSFSYQFKPEDAPNVIARGVWFDGKYFRETGTQTWQYTSENSRLSLNILTDKQRYYPGDEVKLQLAVKDTSGQPVQGTFNVSVLDKALLAFRTAGEQILTSLYSQIPSGVFYTYSSHQDPRTPGAEGGGGCFLAGTHILMADGSLKTIENIQVGDQILTRRTTTDAELIADTVTDTISHQVREYLVINDQLRITPEHIVWVNRSWQIADRLRVGDSLLDARNQPVVVRSLERRFENVAVYNLSTQTTHTFMAEGLYVHNEKGDRSVFKDVVFYKNLSTDNQGTAQASFKLPDNITSWAITAQGLSQDAVPKAGSQVTEIAVSQDLFVMTTLAEEYLRGDQPVLQLRAFGNLLQPGQAVEFFVEAPSLGLTNRTTLSGTAFTPANFPLGQLPSGQHTIIVGVKANGLEDKLTRTITVRENRLTRPTTKLVPIEVNGGIAVPEAASPITVTFTQAQRGPAYKVLETLAAQSSDRLDDRLARILAQQWLYPDQPQNETLSTDIYQVKGGLNLLPHSDEDLYLSALVALTTPDMIDAASLNQYFNSVLQSNTHSRTEYILAMAGRAGLHQPVLISLQRFAQETDLTTVEKIYLGLGLASLGDQTTAQTLFAPVLSSATPTDDTLTITDLANPDQKQAVTWLAAALAQSVGSSQTLAFVHGAQSLTSKENVSHLEASLWVKTTLETAATGNGRLVYELNGQSTEFVFDPTQRAHSVLLSPDQLASLNISVAEGTLVAIVKTETPVTSNQTLSDLAVERHFEVVGGAGSGQPIKEGDLVQVSLPFTIMNSNLTGCWQVSDWLPAGLKVVTQPSLYGSSIPDRNWYPYEVSTQKISFCVQPQSTGKSDTIRYYARVVQPGLFRTEGALLQPMNQTGIFTTSAPDDLTISPL